MYFVVDSFTTGAARCVYSHRDTTKKRRPNLYSLMMDWPMFETNSLLDDPFSSSINSPLMSDPFDPLFDDFDKEFLKADDWFNNDLF